MPRHMNLTTVKIAPVKATADVIMDSVFQAPRSDAIEQAVVTVRAQIYYDSFNRLTQTRGGDRGVSFGYLVFSARYLRQVGFTPSVGDRVTEVIDHGSVFRPVSFRVVQVQPSGHLPNPELVVAFFEYDREARAA